MSKKKHRGNTTSCPLPHHTRRRLQDGGNDLSLSLSLCVTRSVKLFYNNIHQHIESMCPKSYLYIYDFSAYLHMCPSQSVGTDQYRFWDRLVLGIFHPEGHVFPTKCIELEIGKGTMNAINLIKD